jgi:hypothetical protein
LKSFERAHDATAQSAFEWRTGVGPRLDRLLDAMSTSGRMMVFEKPGSSGGAFRCNALAARGLQLFEQPQLVRYALVEEVSDDGPFFVLKRGREMTSPGMRNQSPTRGVPSMGHRAVRTVDAGQPALREPLAVRSTSVEQLNDKR